MLISIDWIKDFVDLPCDDANELANRFTLGSAEVEEVVKKGEYLLQTRVAEVKKIEPHPEADKLNLVSFDYGQGQIKKVVCGAENVYVGMKTPFAPIGTTLPIGFTLEPKKIRGVLSDGMLCSEQELGLSEQSKGIMDLPKDAPVGKSLSEYWGERPDVVIDVDNKSLTHRPDMWGHYGVAREFAALFEKELKRPFDANWMQNLKSYLDKRESPIKLKVEKDSSCLAYYGLSLENVEVGESPSWIQSRLLTVGLRPINNIVDISNYVMIELGIPLHIFDRDKIEGGKLTIKRIGKAEEFVTLDEQKRELLPSDTVICDERRPLVLAGIMGGLESGVSESTKNIFIEVANWKAAQTRQTSTRLGLRTDSSQRYEKTLDSLQCERTLFRTLELVLQLCPKAKVVGGVEYDGEDLDQIKEVVIKTSAHKISKVLGVEVSFERIEKILSSLDFKIQGDANAFNVTVPSFRATKDIEYEADIIEEIGRVIGYDNIPSLSPKLDIFPVNLSPAQKLHRSIRNFMVYHARSFELMTYPMVGTGLLEKSKWPSKELLKIKNALSVDAEVMRPSMIPNFLNTAMMNVKHYSQFRFFELGRSYHPETKNFSKEKSLFGACFYDREENTFMDLVNSVERLTGDVNLPAQLSEKNSKFPNELVDEGWIGLHPFEFYNIRLMGKMKGVVFSVHPLLLREFKIKGHLSMAFIDLSEVEKRELKDKVSYRPLSKYPGSSFDWTVVAPHDAPVGEILAEAQKVKIKQLIDVKLVDIFSLSNEQKSVTLRATFLDPEKTLEGEFLTSAREQLVGKLKAAGFPLKS